MGWVDPWVGLVRDFAVFDGLRWVGSNTTNVRCTIFFLIITQHTIAKDCASKMQGGMKKLAFSTNISLYFENGTTYGHSYNGRQLTADRFAALFSVGLGWSIF